WMWLAEGQKLLNFVDFEDCDLLLDSERKTLRDLPPAELLHLNGNALWGRVRQGWIVGGDFIYFPPACAHCVETYQPSIGLGGYAVPADQTERMGRVVSWYTERKLDLGGGM